MAVRSSWPKLLFGLTGTSIAFYEFIKYRQASLNNVKYDREEEQTAKELAEEERQYNERNTVTRILLDCVKSGKCFIKCNPAPNRKIPCQLISQADLRDMEKNPWKKLEVKKTSDPDFKPGFDHDVTDTLWKRAVFSLLTPKSILVRSFKDKQHYEDNAPVGCTSYGEACDFMIETHEIQEETECVVEEP